MLDWLLFFEVQHKFLVLDLLCFRTDTAAGFVELEAEFVSRQ